MIDARIYNILACPKCKGDLINFTDRLFCQNCGIDFKVINGVPILFADKSFNLPEGFVEKKSSFKKIFKQYFPKTSMTSLLDKSFFDYANSVNETEVVLNLGSGIGRFDSLLKHKNIINLDIMPNEGVHIIGDGHKLPIKSNSVGCVFSNAVLEHTARPWLVANEIYRVLKEDGIVCINVPFLNIIHEAYDYYRYTPQGLKTIFYRFDEIKSGISSGPSSFITYFMPEYISLFFPYSLLRSFVKDVLSGLFYPIKYLDYLIKKKDRCEIIANSFYFVGRKK